MTVFVANATTEDISAAAEYGDLLYVNHRFIFPDNIDDKEIPSAFVRNMEQAVNKFDPATDYLLIVGDYLQLIQLSALLSQRVGTFRCLRYSRDTGTYYPVHIRPSANLFRQQLKIGR